LKKAAKLAAPPPLLKVSQWADKFRQLSSEASAEAGKWHTDRAPYQREMMDAMCDATVEAVVIMSSAQIGKTEIINNIIGYHVHLDPAPILLLQPTILYMLRKVTLNQFNVYSWLFFGNQFYPLEYKVRANFA
jgi:phage terminase large subunit GpA-like protein